MVTDNLSSAVAEENSLLLPLRPRLLRLKGVRIFGTKEARETIAAWEQRYKRNLSIPPKRVGTPRFPRTEEERRQEYEIIQAQKQKRLDALDVPPSNITSTELTIWQRLAKHFGQDGCFWQDDHFFRRKYLNALPAYLTCDIGEKYCQLFQSNTLSDGLNGRQRANKFLRETLGGQTLPRINLVHKRYALSKEAVLDLPFLHQLEELPTLERKQLKSLAHLISLFLVKVFTHFCDNYSASTLLKSIDDASAHSVTNKVYIKLADTVRMTGITPPYWNKHIRARGSLTLAEMSSALLRMCSLSWWVNKLRRKRNFQREHMFIASGQVQKQMSPYVSKVTLDEWIEQKKCNRRFLKLYDLVNQRGDRVALDEMVNRSNANPAIRRCELMLRMSGFEDIANEIGDVGQFYTITAPSRYHSAYNRGGFIAQWNGASPRDTQNYLCCVWAKIRAALNRQQIRVYGFRVVEPHHDATPHWHLLLFMRPEHKAQVTEILRYYACKEDSEELTSAAARKARFHAVSIDPARGRATGYIAKYISKNIDGYALAGEKDFESGEDLTNMAHSVTAWASRWGIRQFQQIGGAPVTVWRELRRIGDKQLNDAKMDAVLCAADVGCWASYTMAQGGTNIPRNALTVRLLYATIEQGNAYLEDVSRIVGVFSPQRAKTETYTRLIKWERVPKLKPVVEEAVLPGGNAAPWSSSSVNNCTRRDETFYQQARLRRYDYRANPGNAPNTS